MYEYPDNNKKILELKLLNIFDSIPFNELFLLYKFRSFRIYEQILSRLLVRQTSF